MPWKVLMARQGAQWIDDNRIAMVGSPGVGKTCLLMLVALHIAAMEKQFVVVVRKVKKRHNENKALVLALDDREH